MPPPAELAILLSIGLSAGLLGGLLGIGGSIIMIPALTVFLGRDQQLAQAAAMIINVCVAVPGVIRHTRAKAIPWPLVWRMIPVGIVFILIGVAASNVMETWWLEKTFGVFLLYVIYANLKKVIGRRTGDEPTETQTGWARAGGVGTVMGFSAGLLGIGGGVITVPLLHRVTRLPLRNCIAASATAMCLTSPIGAWRKNMALPDLGFAISDSLAIAACLAPTAIIGALIGAGLTHTLPVRNVRIVLIALLTLACTKYLFL